MKRLLFGLCCLFLSSLAFHTPARAMENPITTNVPETALLVFSEVYSNGQNTGSSNESGSEFIEIYNRSNQTIDLTEYQLSRPDTAAHFGLSGTIAPHTYTAIYPSFALVNSGGTAVLTHLSSETAVTLTYTQTVGGDETASYQLTDTAANVWNKIAPTPNQPAPALEEPPAEEPPVNEPPKPCTITGVHLSEIVANPSGSDTLGGEFIELYNEGDVPVSLVGCTLITDKLSGFSFTEADIMPAKTYRTIHLSDKLLNGGGTVTFQTSTYEEVVQYSSLGDDEAWAFITNAWQTTTLPTPNAVNQPSPGKGAVGDIEVKEEPAPCPAGKFRNPETGRCKNIEVEAAAITPCGPGKERNPETNRCRNIVTAGASLAACGPGQERNPTTNRCRKVATPSTNELAPCKDGYERNVETNRCRKVVSTPANTAHIDERSKQNPTHDLLVLGAAGAAIGGFLLYEYRGAIHNKLRGLRASKK